MPVLSNFLLENRKIKPIRLFPRGITPNRLIKTLTCRPKHEKSSLFKRIRMLAVIDSGGANITSVLSAFERLGISTVFTKSEQQIKEAERVILPGVGAAKDAMAKLRDSGLVDVIRNLQQPVLGICLGMQLLYDESEEGSSNTLGVLKGNVTRFIPAEGRSVPHMGWNNVGVKSDHPLLHGINSDSYFYFVHSYYAPMTGDTIASCEYGQDFTAITARGNFMGCQFHPERSGTEGRKILENFMSIKA